MFLNFLLVNILKTKTIVYNFSRFGDVRPSVIPSKTSAFRKYKETYPFYGGPGAKPPDSKDFANPPMKLVNVISSHVIYENKSD